jgi:thiamine biosynthesis lipoprotein
MPAYSLFIHRFRALGSDNEIQLYAGDAGAAQHLAQTGIDEANRIETKYTRYREGSLTSTINRHAGGDWVEIDSETAALLDYADTCYRESDGLFDLTSGVLRRAWNFRVAVVPDAAFVAALLPLVGWKLIERYPDRIRLPKPGMELDFGGIGKEYCADRVATALLDAGAQSGLVNLGGDIRVIGPHPGGKPWAIGIRHPRRQDAILTTVMLAQGALATSGDYERYFELDGRRYCHMLNPRTGYPVSTMQSVTVVAPLCTVAGSVCTLAMLKGDAGLAYLQDQGFPNIAVDLDGRVHDTLAESLS